VQIIPAIDIRGGRAVRLGEHGDFARERVVGVDPVGLATHWAAQGAQRLHVVDLDAAREGRPVNDAIIRRIVAEAGVPVQVAGGVRDHDAIHAWATAGADRIIIGTAAVEHPELVEHAMRKHQDKIAVAIDARGDRAATHAWVSTSEVAVDDFIRRMAALGVRHFVYTDIARDGTDQHPDFARVRRVLDVLADTGAPATFIYSGGVSSIGDVLTLSEYGIEGAIVGGALYDGRLDLAEAMRALAHGGGTGRTP